MLINIILELIKNVAKTIESTGKPLESMPAVMNWAPPAYMNNDIAPTKKGLRPTELPIIPKANPMPMYPKTVGNVSFTPVFTSNLSFICSPSLAI